MAVVTGPRYDLEKLGWRAFQDLCAVVLQQVLGQMFHTFADSNDAGRDGAFHGRWAVPSDAPADRLAGLGAPGVATVVQCKFSASRTGTLTPSMVDDELAKAAKLHADGLCDAYVLMTNLRVTGTSSAKIAARLAKVGIASSVVLDGTWLSQTISKNGALRRYVPRVYGLGDLGLILDERGQKQARALLARLSDDLATFVPTAAYRRAADALAGQGFVLLLGEPMCGKSTIAATLAVAALDGWGCGVHRVDTAAELIDAWNPDDPAQLYWIDDAFGSIEHDPALTDGWARRMDKIMTAIGQGARVVMTSRDYIYREARDHLKDYAYPRLREQLVTVDVTELTPEERRQILYNHLKAGDHSSAVLRRWQPHLPAAAAVDRFEPEVARRLGRRAFTRPDDLQTAADLVDFLGRPVAFLADTLRRLPPATRAALACVYVSGDELPSPVEFTPRLAETANRLGGSQDGILRALKACDGTFLQLARTAAGDPAWRFRHPTIREGFAAVVAEDPDAVNVFVDGLTDDELLRQTDCGGPTTQGTRVLVPTALYPRVAPRIRLPAGDGSDWLQPAAWYLQHSCSDAFLRVWSEQHDGDLHRLTTFGMYTSAYWQPKVLARLHRAGALPEPVRAAGAARLREHALYFDGGALDEPARTLFTPDELAAVVDEIKTEIIPDLERHIDDAGDGWGSDIAPEQRYDQAAKAVRVYGTLLADDRAAAAALEDAREYISSRIRHAEDDYVSPPSSTSLAPSDRPAPPVVAGRNHFDDLADGR
jgi:hypothetical protein